MMCSERCDGACATPVLWSGEARAGGGRAGLEGVSSLAEGVLDHAHQFGRLIKRGDRFVDRLVELCVVGGQGEHQGGRCSRLREANESLLFLTAVFVQLEVLVVEPCSQALQFTTDRRFEVREAALLRLTEEAHRYFRRKGQPFYRIFTSVADAPALTALGLGVPPQVFQVMNTPEDTTPISERLSQMLETEAGHRG
jgi:hypothetical protein